MSGKWIGRVLRIEEKDVQLGLLGSQFARGGSARTKISEVEFEEMDITFACRISQLFDGRHGLFFASGSQVDFGVVLSESLCV